MGEMGRKFGEMRRKWGEWIFAQVGENGAKWGEWKMSGWQRGRRQVRRRVDYKFDRAALAITLELNAQASASQFSFWEVEDEAKSERK